MSFSKYIITMILGTIICWILFGSIIYLIDPFESGVFGILFFYISLFLSLIGTFAILGLLIRVKFFKIQVLFKQVLISFRQSVLFSVLIIGTLFLKSQNLFNIYSIVLFIIILTIIEFFLISYKKVSN